MYDCTLCSIASNLFSYANSMFWCAMDYPVVVFCMSVCLSLLMISNIETARLLCDRRSGARGFNIRSSSMATTSRASRATYDYGEQHGPHQWQCPSVNQSPINIIEEYVHKLSVRELLNWNHYDDLPTAMWIENNGHTVVLHADFRGNVPTISGADLLASYTFVQLCFRWNLLGNEGSEHMINYKKYSLELQAMHRTGPSGDCTSSYDILMLAYFFELSSDNPYLDPLIQNLHKIRHPFKKVEIPPFPLSYLCHQYRTGFYSYGGSLTEPPCYQGAEWFIFPEPLAISERQLNEFRHLLTADRKSLIVRNARPVQPMDCSRLVNLNQYNPLENGVAEHAENDDHCDEESYE